MLRYFILSSVVLASAGVVSAATIHVPADQSSIQAGIDAASSGDTVLVAPGVYTENIDYHNKAIVVKGSAGFESTFLQPAVPSNNTVVVSTVPSGTTTFEGFTVQNGGATNTFVISGASPLITGCRFRNNIPVGSKNIEVISCSSASAVVTRNLFYGNGGIGCVGLRGGAAGSQIINNTFDGNERGFFSIAGGGTALNNIVTHSITYGVAALDPSQYSLLDYNDVWANGTNYMTGVPGVHDISADPLYLEPAQHVYTLKNGSPCINAGDPAPQYNDPDGTRNDIGAFNTQSVLPTVTAIAVNSNNQCFLSGSPEISWSYYDTAFAQTGYQIQVGTDADWTIAESWDPGSVIGSDSMATYGGSALQSGQTYFLRIRVENSIGWGDWTEQSFVFRTAQQLLVPSQYATIQSAIDAATACDEVVVGPGVYVENLNFNQKGILVRTLAGAATTILQPLDPYSATVRIESVIDGTPEFRGFTVQGGGATYTFRVSGASPTIDSCIFRDNIPVGSGNVEVISCTSASALITRNIFYGNGGIGCVGLREGSASSRIVNNTFDGNERGFFSIAGGGYALNNIVTNSLSYGVAALSSDQYTVLAYNDVWNNAVNYMTGVPGTNDISLDPKYRNTNEHDYSLSFDSPCINAGDPNPIYNDADGSRNDIGALSGFAAMPAALDLTINNQSVCYLTANPEIRWTFLDTASTQVGYQIQVGTDLDWSAAEMWDSGPVTSSVTLAVYAGSPLLQDQTYYVRVRVENNVKWGDWSSTVFVYHTPTTVYVPGPGSKIQDAINAARPCDVILVGSGTYTENLKIVGVEVILRSTSGAEKTVIQPLNAGTPVIQIQNMLSGQPEIRGFTVQGGGGSTGTLSIVDASPLITECIFRNNIPVGSPNVEVISCTRASATVIRNLFYGNGGIGCVGLRDGSTGSKIINNTFDGNERGFFSIAGGGTAINNIVTHSLTYGVAALSPSQFSRLDYNDVWGNGTNYMTGVPGVHDISADPAYLDRSNHLYLLSALSPCLNAGDPDPQYNDPDSSRNDMGAYPLQAHAPSSAVLEFPPDTGTSILYSFTPEFRWQASTDPDWYDTVRYKLQLSVTPGFSLTFSVDSIMTTRFTLADSLSFGTHYWWRVIANDRTGLSTTSLASNFWTWQLGDVDQSHNTDIADLSRLIDYLFISFHPISPMKVADMDGDCKVDISDLSRLIDYMYISFDPLSVGCEP